MDDNETNRRIVHEQVISWGMKNGMAEDGPSALERLRSLAESGEPYDLAILDLDMPKMDGIELAHTIKADPSIASTKLILLTSMGLRGEAEQARRVGFSAYLTKPVRQSKLYDAIATVVDSPAGVGSAQSPVDTPLVERRRVGELTSLTRQRPARAHVLVAEDNQVNQRVAVMMLQRLGYRADVAANGLEAIEALSRIPYSAILMDVQMPEMDGYAATKEIRRREEGKGRHTPIIAMTANAMQGDKEKALEAGMDGYVPKPVKREEMGAVLERWVPQTEGEEATPEEVSDDKASSAGVTDPLDQGVLADLHELGGQELLEEVGELFLEEAPAQLEALWEATEGGDAPSIKRVAHALQESCGNMGATRMASICVELEDVGHSGEVERAPMLVESLKSELGRVRKALEKKLTRS